MNISTRMYIAIEAMKAILRMPSTEQQNLRNIGQTYSERVAERSYDIADCMLRKENTANIKIPTMMTVEEVNDALGLTATASEHTIARIIERQVIKRIKAANNE